MGWKGVGVGEAFGAIVTSANKEGDCAGASVEHPASVAPRSIEAKRLTMKIRLKLFFMELGTA